MLTPMRARLLRVAMRGQAMSEYAFITFALAGALLMPNPFIAGNKSFLEAMLQAIQSYWNGFYFVLFLPFP